MFPTSTAALRSTLRASVARAAMVRGLATAPAPASSAAVNAFVARTGFRLSSPDTLQQALTHRTFDHGRQPSNDRLEFLGQQALGLYVTEYVHAKYPNIPADALRDAVNAYTSPASLSILGRSLGVQDVMRWTAHDAAKSGESHMVAKVMKALIGALYHDKGAMAARKFIHASLLSKDLDMEAVLAIKEPKRLLAALLKRQQRERPVSRMLHETGRHSAAPVFVVGVFSGTRKIGEAAGSSIKMAEHRAAKDALMKHFLTEVGKPLLPSETEGMAEEDALTFVGTKVADTLPVL